MPSPFKVFAQIPKGIIAAAIIAAAILGGLSILALTTSGCDTYEYDAEKVHLQTENKLLKAENKLLKAEISRLNNRVMQEIEQTDHVRQMLLNIVTKNLNLPAPAFEPAGENCRCNLKTCPEHCLMEMCPGDCMPYVMAELNKRVQQEGASTTPPDGGIKGRQTSGP